MKSPMSIKGYDIDPVTRRPVHLEAEAAMQKATSDKIALSNDISSQEGSVLLKTINRLFIARIEQLISSDPECQAYEKILQEIHYKLNVGEKVIANRFNRL